jgi:3-dehydroquinate dehydratase-1
MICISFGNIETIKLLKYLKKIDFAEIRLDLLYDLNPENIKKIFSFAKNNQKSLIVTFRKNTGQKFHFSQQNLTEGYSNTQIKYIKLAIEHGAEYVDIALNSEKNLIKELRDYTLNKGVKLILSYHNFESTPDLYYLIKIVKTGFSHQADFVKIATKINHTEDISKLISLLNKDIYSRDIFKIFGIYKSEYSQTFSKSIIPVGLGDKGKILRILYKNFGIPFTYASFNKNFQTADGQIEYMTLIKYQKYFKTILK